MSESTEHLIVLRATPGRDSTASDIARSRGEFRRQPHLTTISVEVGTAVARQPSPLPSGPIARTPKDERTQGQYGRARMHH
jgi:hypothetical protein